MTYREPYSNPLTPVYQWSYAPNGWLRSSVVSVDPFRRYILKLQAEALVRRVPLVLVYHGQVRGDAGPLKEDTSERRALEEGRQIVRWLDNTDNYQSKGVIGRRGPSAPPLHRHGWGRDDEGKRVPAPSSIRVRQMGRDARGKTSVR